MKRCGNCDLEKSDLAFSFKNRTKNIRHTVCKQCHAEYRKQHYLLNHEIYKEKARRWDASNPLRTIFSRIQRSENSLSITFDEFVALYEMFYVKQNGLCKICSKPETQGRKLDADHCHVTGKFRGLLCSTCNLGLGYFRDSIELLKKAVDYLGV